MGVGVLTIRSFSPRFGCTSLIVGARERVGGWRGRSRARDEGLVRSDLVAIPDPPPPLAEALIVAACSPPSSPPVGAASPASAFIATKVPNEPALRAATRFGVLTKEVARVWRRPSSTRRGAVCGVCAPVSARTARGTTLAYACSCVPYLLG